jgi:hypothetical protein
MGIKLSNNAFGTLAASITSSSTSITLTTGQGARFPTLAGGDYFYATLVDTSNNLEIVKCTARSTDVLTVVRAQESTTARAYNTGDRIEIRITAQTFVDATTFNPTPAEVSDEINTSTGYFDLPSGTTAQRPGSPVEGMIRHNTDLDGVEFYDSGAWKQVNTSYSVEYLVVAGGGGATGTGAGGGGGGGYRTNVVGATSGGGASAESALSVSAGASYTITVGAGGAANTGSTYGGDGGNSVFGSITSIGGGGGTGNASSATSRSGGSGGGGTSRTSSMPGGAGTSGQGYAGGHGGLVSGSQSNSRGGGGGGAGSVGLGASDGSVRADGGNGVASSITGTSVTRAGGGGGGSENYAAGLGGSGGGGNGGRYPDASTYPAAVSGTANTGGGGGGGYQTAGAGGSGVVIVRYLGTQRGSGGTVTSSGGYTIHTFTSSGTFTA